VAQPLNLDLVSKGTSTKTNLYFTGSGALRKLWDEHYSSNFKKLRTQPKSTQIMVDNQSLQRYANAETEKKAKGLKTFGRHLNYIKTADKAGVSDIKFVDGKHQKADPITKSFNSPTEQIRKIEFVMGSQGSLDRLGELAKELGESKKGSKKALTTIAESGAGNEVLVVNNTIENAKVTRKVTKILNGRFIDVVE
jgi:hypothetical protein